MIELNFDESKKLGIARCINELTALDLEGYLARWNPVWAAEFDELFIATGVDINVNFTDMLTYCTNMIEFNQQVGSTGRTAFVADDAKGREVAGYYESMHTLVEDRVVVVFDNEEEAHEWLEAGRSESS